LPVDPRPASDNHCLVAENSSNQIARRCLVSGRVQGVYYRGSARERARSAQLTGYARNLPDGRVEVLACGEEGAVLRFIEWLWQGPSAAQVLDVSIEVLELSAEQWPREFRTG
jgi:acylphosphatase